MIVPLLDLNAQYNGIIEDIKKEINDVISTHKYILGPKVKEFEEKAEKLLESNNAIGCASGTDALVLALKALKIEDGDEVITTPFTFFATAGTISRVGAKPVFVDIDKDTFNLDPDLIEAKITDKTKAIMPVHLFGQPCDMDKINEIAKKYNLKVIEDNAQGIGAKFDGQIAGTIGDIGTLSFFPSKNLGGMGDGGMCLTQNDDLAVKLKQLRVHGENPKYFHKWVGLNSRLDSLQAAVLNVKIDYLTKWSEMRRENAKYYNEKLSDNPHVKIPVMHEKAESIYNQYTLVVENRNELLNYLKEKSIGCNVYYPRPLHLQECFVELGGKKGDCPNAEFAADHVLSIPIYSELTRDQQDYVIKTINDFYKIS